MCVVGQRGIGLDVFPRSWIYFGVLHGMAVMLLICRATAPWGRGLWLAGALAVGLAQLAPWAHAAWGCLPP